MKVVHGMMEAHSFAAMLPPFEGYVILFWHVRICGHTMPHQHVASSKYFIEPILDDYEHPLAE
jgi:hypothetical protein